jgi:hypothetical protein
MPPCDYVAKTVRTRHHHCKFYPAGVNFDEKVVGQHQQGRGVLVLSSVLRGSPFESFEYGQTFWSTLIGSNFKKKHVELFSFL